MRDLIQNFFHGLFMYDDAYRFIKKHRLWEGFGKYRIVPIALLIGALGVGFSIFGRFKDNLSTFREEGVVQGAVKIFESSGSAIGDGINFMTHGAYKYVILLMLEVLIFHFALRTIEILSGQKFKVKLSTFIHAQIRVLKIIILNFGVEIAFSIALSIIFGIFGFSWMKVFLMFFVQCFLIGFMMMDNYNEILGLKLRQSFKHTTKYIGATLGIGLPLYIIMLVPIVGSVIGPLMAVVAASLLMHDLAPNEIDEMKYFSENALLHDLDEQLRL